MAAIGLFFIGRDGIETPVSSSSFSVTKATPVEPAAIEPTVQFPAAPIMEPELASEPAAVTDPMLDLLYDSPSPSVKLTAARQLAVRNDEASFCSIARVLMAAEMTGEPTNETLAKELAKILGQMRGPQIQAIATELAYSPSPLLSAAATDAAVASDPAMRREELAVGTGREVSPVSEAAAQAILDAEIASHAAASARK